MEVPFEISDGKLEIMTPPSPWHQVTTRTVDQILAMRESKEGWGKVARDLGYKNLGSVISSVKATDMVVTRVASDRGPRVDKVSSTDKPDKPEKVSKPDKPERIERVERPEKPERPGR